VVYLLKIGRHNERDLDEAQGNLELRDLIIHYEMA
jgi:hypothetical protein